MNILKNIKELNLEHLIREVEDDRKKIEEIRKGNINIINRLDFKTILFIVESPNKARTISNFFGKPSYRKIRNINVYEFSLGNKQILVAATKGHLIDLTTKNIGLYGIEVKNEKIITCYNTIKRCLDCGSQFTEYDEDGRCPYCGSKNIRDSKEIIETLQKIAQEVDIVLIGTDPDTEGEFIAYTVYLLLKPFNEKIYRVEFHEVTRSAILRALENPREINMNLVKAQIIRRIEDRWLGFSLSQIVQEKYNKKWLSAGRVQTPVLGWIVDRYNERIKSKSFFITINPEKENIIVDTDIKDRKTINKIKKQIIGEKVTIKEYIEYEDIINPLPPYNTSTMLQDAVLYLKIDTGRIMRVAQELFEQGLITYHRTDSTRISELGMNIAKEYISKKFGENYAKLRSWGEGGAHEGIRPTRPLDSDELKRSIEEGDIEVYIDLTKYHFGLYDLIFRRFIASQMKEVKVKMFKEIIHIPVIEKDIEISGIINVIEDGWNLVNPYRLEVMKKNKIEEFIIEDVKSNKIPKVKLYKEADVISLMRERRIGRPSTYATIIEKILSRGYIINKNGYMIPTKLGIQVYQFLQDNYGKYVSEERTRKLEEKMDNVENGNERFEDIINEIYSEVLEIIERKNI